MSDIDEIIPLRPHHGLCIQFFEGKGYSSEFVENMTEVIDRLKLGAYVKLTDTADSVCKACPNSNNGICATCEKVARYDNSVIELCGISIGTELRWSDFSERVKTNIIESGKMNNVCSDCQWSCICFK